MLQLAVPGFRDIFIFNPMALAPWMFITSIFLHGGITHLLFNSLALIMFAPYLERLIGSKHFVVLFLLAGLAGSVLFFLTIYFGIIDPVPALGASGAIYGILGALSILMPRLVVYIYFFPVPIRVATVFWFVIETAGSFNPNSRIASAAHLGGLLFGLLFGLYYQNKIRVESAPAPASDKWYSAYLR